MEDKGKDTKTINSSEDNAINNEKIKRSLDSYALIDKNNEEDNNFRNNTAPDLTLDSILLSPTISSQGKRRRRLSSVYIDAIHEVPEPHVAPAQLYSTESGRLFHAGQIIIVLVGLPARGKTHLAVSLTRYLRWLGVRTHAFHLGDYRRKFISNDDIPSDYFLVDPSTPTSELRAKIMDNCKNDIFKYFHLEGGQVAVFDAVNPIARNRKILKDEFLAAGIQVLFIETLCQRKDLIEANVLEIKMSSPDYIGWKDKDTIVDYLERINAKIPYYETINDPSLNYIKRIDYGERIVANCSSLGYLANRIILYILNLHKKTGSVFFARSGKPLGNDLRYATDTSLSPEGIKYAEILTKTLEEYRSKKHSDRVAKLEKKLGKNSSTLQAASTKPGLIVWTSTRIRTVETSEGFRKLGYPVRQRTQLSQMQPGVLEEYSAEKLAEKYSETVERSKIDPYHTRFPRAESYQDVAIRLEPVILEIERISDDDVLIIAHSTILRVLYGYLMACSIWDIPSLKFPRNVIVEIIPSAYQNIVNYIQLEGVEP